MSSLPMLSRTKRMKRFMFARSMRSVLGSQIGLFIGRAVLGTSVSGGGARRASGAWPNYKGSPRRGQRFAGAKKERRREAGVRVDREDRSTDQQVLFLLAGRERGRIPVRALAATGPGLARIDRVAV